MTDAKVSILDGATFVVSDRNGDVDASPEEVDGLFYPDTRFLSRWVLTVDGTRSDVLSVEHGSYFEAQFFLYPPTGTIYENPYLSVIRKRKVGDGFHEDVSLPELRKRAEGGRAPPRGGRRLHRPLRGEGRAAEEGRDVCGGR